jgi:hypothetical protein
VRTGGYYVLKKKLPEELCDKLLEFALTTNAQLRASTKNENTRVENYSRNNPKAIRYDFIQQDLADSPIVQEIILDESIFEVAQNYLDCPPILDLIFMWWSTAFSSEANEEAAQLYHFDMDRIKWLKFFFYITDVKPENGPHTFIKGSHKDKGIPFSLLSKGYARLSDEEVEKHYKPEDIIELSAPKGTIIAEDTRGLHKGKNLQSGNRLVFQLQFSNSLFGTNYKDYFLNKIKNDTLKKQIKKYPQIYSRLVPNKQTS